ncbi:hypothetical protein LSH36_172g00041 [Paralvinella palmiformis]|uniref:C2H2-type domain-containing protein n=1 Tax=Paralvinella palmiformis TaxID=53620 RepID=A0AAD9JSE7_9ANNE|nr:hypothetical protein LSH36_172g00041 [Paralvinella palmiformis]
MAPSTSTLFWSLFLETTVLHKDGPRSHWGGGGLHSSLARPHDLICQVCEKHCSDEEKFFKHIHKYHPEYWRVFSGGRPLSDFIGHHEPRRREKPFHCQICHKRYSHETGYLKHLATHPESDPSLRQQLWSCPVCRKVFTKESYLLRHMEMKLDDDHAAELVVLKKKLKIGTEKPIPPGQASATLSTVNLGLAMTIAGQRELGEGTSGDFNAPRDVGRQMQQPQRAVTSPQRGPGLESIGAAGGAAYSQENKPPDLDVHGRGEGLKFSPLHRDALRSPPPQPMSLAEYQAGVPSTVGSPQASTSSSPSTPLQRQPHPLLTSALDKLATSQPRPISRSSDAFSGSRNGDENAPYNQRVNNDSALPKDMTVRETSRADNSVGGSLRRSNSDSAFSTREPFGHPSGQENLEYGRPPSHAAPYSRSPPDDGFSPTSAYLPTAGHQGTLTNPASFRPSMHGMIPPSYLPPSIHTPPYTSGSMPVANPYLTPGAELSDRDVATALQHLARTASSSLYNNR